ncbi:hypothetical protein ACLIMP_07010 [Novosphingobium aerophilum]|uniref:hypothetical protein n=1 Tax=Novosphingobium TaxID=165696 RepID=UPI0006C8D1A7|nr:MULTISPECIES: hypothetical protein [unclassified Novosphingobium]KPH60318.1 hypothetical protein ADT71_21355 [Novosphingobium sp. ST904]MPS68634.1 hypothetical protein [Novosphingobium sp.]TCM36770.1 hypothetical protein EDF59_1134 [Novosphingobium sp. ST904]WRT93964.1 hypothetical protein U9J33_05495 [Novosphingobium sp. RL4]
MLYIQAARLAFIHIPKNAGQSVRNALAQCDALCFAAMATDLGVNEPEAERLMEAGVTGMPGLGRVQPEHVPLAFLERHFPATWSTLVGSRSFILARPPRDRFFSALLQRLREHRGMTALRADDPILKEEARHVCDWLDARGHFCDMEYIHFSRQCDYAELGGERIVTKIFPIDRIDAAALWVKTETGLTIDIPHDHARHEPRKWAGPIQPAARFVGRKLLPPSLKQAIYPFWMKSGAFAKAANRYGSITLGDEVERFIAEYYARDETLYREAKDNAEAFCKRKVA